MGFRLVPISMIFNDLEQRIRFHYIDFSAIAVEKCNACIAVFL